MGIEAVKIAVYRRLPRPLKIRAVRLATPSFTVGAIGLITDDRSRVLLVRPTYRDGWLPPGGFLDKGEVPVQALEREVREELGLEISFAEPHRVHFDVRRRGVTFVCVGVAPAGTNPSVRSPEIAEVAWFSLDDLPQLPNDFDEGIPAEDLAAVRRASPASFGS